MVIMLPSGKYGSTLDELTRAFWANTVVVPRDKAATAASAPLHRQLARLIGEKWVRVSDSMGFSSIIYAFARLPTSWRMTLATKHSGSE
jgi:hypothetical protein